MLVILLSKKEHNHAKEIITVFIHKSLQDFFIASKIVEDLTHSFDNSRKDPKNMLLNQKSLINNSSYSFVLQLLAEAVRDKRISKESLIELIGWSRRDTQRELNPVEKD